MPEKIPAPRINITPVAIPEKPEPKNPYDGLIPDVQKLADAGQAAQATVPSAQEAAKFKKLFGEAANKVGLRRKFISEVEDEKSGHVTLTFTVVPKKEKTTTEATSETE